MNNRRAKRVREHYAGFGADGNEYAVTSLEGTAGVRRKPCATCPWRMDSQVGRFPAEAFRASASTAYDAATSTFACHESGDAAMSICAGFILSNSLNNLGVRIARAGGKPVDSVHNPDCVPLYASYRDMAEANGVDPDDPVLAKCRADDEAWKP